MNPKVVGIIGGVFLLFSDNYFEIFKIFDKCGSDNGCKAVELELYIARVIGAFGGVRPAIVLTQIIKSLFHRNRDAGNAEDVASYGAIYVIVELLLEYSVDWTRYSLECLRKDDCEPTGDILIWIVNMKRSHCKSPDEDYEELEKCEELGTCEEDYDNAVDRCAFFFNSIPLMMLMTFMALINVLALHLGIDNDDNKKGGAGGGNNGGDGNKEGDANDNRGSDRGGGNDGGDKGGGGNNGGGAGDNKGGRNDPKGDNASGSNSDADPKNKGERGDGDKKNESDLDSSSEQDSDSDCDCPECSKFKGQLIECQCLSCHSDYLLRLENPMEIYCHDCN